MGDRLRLAVLGGGYWGRNIIRNLTSIDGVEVTILCEPNNGQAEECKGLYPWIETCTEQGRLFHDNGVDGVVVCTPPSCHYEPTREALAAGKHVFVEKPMAMSYSEGEELVSLADKKGVVLFVDETFLYDPAVSVVKGMIDKGAIGQVYHIVMERLGMGRVRCESNVWWNSAPHDLSILRFLFGDVVRSISLHGASYLQRGIEDVTFASLELEGGLTAFIYLSWFHPISTASMVIVGSSGAIFYEGRFAKRKVVLYRYEVGEAPKERVLGVPTPNCIPIKAYIEREVTNFGPEEPLRASCARFVDAVWGGGEPPSSGRRSLETLKALEAGIISLSKGGEKVDIKGGAS